MADWKTILADKIPPAWAENIDAFDSQIELKKQGKVEDKLFAEARLRRGVYGQRYDNGQRHDGKAAQTLDFPSAGLLKGPETLFHAPGMQRIKLPYGGVSPDQLDVLAELGEEYSDAILHVTTRQDIQLHYVHIEDTPDLMRRLAAVGITTREACGNSVRNVTACPIAGVCCQEAFDVTPYADACFRFLLGHPDVQEFGRKFKIAFSGCKQNACGLVNMHDMGFIAATRTVDGKVQQGFEVYVGGGLGAVPYEAKVLAEFATVDEIYPLCQATARVYARLGEKRNRGKARIKFLVDKLGIEELRRLVAEELKSMPRDDSWKHYTDNVPEQWDKPLKPAAAVAANDADPAYANWVRTNVYRQRQPGYVVVTVTLPLGDLTSDQTRGLANLARRYVGDALRTTVDQNIVLRWVSESDLRAVYDELCAMGLGAAGAGTIVDVTSCPGTDTCKLGISSSRGLAGELRERLAARYQQLDDSVKDLHIKISGCFNSCGQHHLADLGFYGISRKVGRNTVPHFRVVLGGQWENNAGSYGLTIGLVPSKRVPDFIDQMTTRYIKERNKGESFREFVARLGKGALKEMVDRMGVVPPYELDRSFYSDWGDPREFTISDIGTGECAGEVVSMVDFDLQAAERHHFEAQLALEANDVTRADFEAYKAMLMGAKALVRMQFPDITDQPDRIVNEFRARFFDTGLFQDRYAGGKFAEYLFVRHARSGGSMNNELARRTMEEAQLFIEAAHACHLRVLAAQRAPLPASPAAAVVS
jgi:sulfite reductase (ferredoxin)